ncbi:MAG: cell division protein FtsA [Hymenobacteraceae bacterium]|nr:cell division protein FtsA [Hymenobacteraceae bacterium]
MNPDKIVVGLDIGTTKICCLVGRRNEFGKLEILGMGKAPSEGVVRGTVQNIDKTVEAIRRAVKIAEDQANIDIKVVNVGVAGSHIRSVRHSGSITRTSDNEISLADVNRLTNDMHRLVTQPGSEIIHVMPQEYTVDYETGVADPVGMNGVRLEGSFHLITAQSQAIANLKKCVQRAGLQLDELILQPLASSMAVLSDEEKEVGVVLVDIGGGTTDIAIFKDHVIRHTAVLPFGGAIVTNDIKQGCAVLPAQAEALKVKFGNAVAERTSEDEYISIPGLRDRAPKEISRRNLAHIIEARMEEVLELVALEIERTGYSHTDLPAGLVITGGGSQLRELLPLADLLTGLETRIGLPNEHLGKSRIEVVKSPMYATTVGLVLAGYRPSLDDRLSRRLEAAAEQDHAAKPIARTEEKARQPDKPKAPTTSGSSGFFKSIIERTKGLLIDDLDDKQY